MAFLNVGKENTTPTNLYYEDHGKGPPVILIHGWPLNAASWEKQTGALLDAGYRVIAYDRRGFGRSSQPASGYDYETFSNDLDSIINQLDLKEVILIGFSMGAGEVARYIGKFGSDRVKKAVFISAVPPFLLKTTDNSSGIEQNIFEGIKAGIKKDRPAFLMDFLRNFYNFDVLGGKKISEQFLQASWNVAVAASPIGTLRCVDSWMTDFRLDVARIDVPSLVIHGDQDRIVPIKSSGDVLAKTLKNATYIKIEGAPHGLFWTHADEVTKELLEFLGPAEDLLKAPPRRHQEERSTLQ